MTRPLVTFVFGLIHGFGFASVLGETEMPRDSIVLALAMFNVGVESGQLLACAVALVALTWIRRQAWQKAAMLAISGMCVGLGGYWFITRVLGT
jgi:hypothetical protein